MRGDLQGFRIHTRKGVDTHAGREKDRLYI